MANNNIGIKFTEDKYATKAEVARELKTSFIDGFWSSIQNYRSTFNRYLSIKTIEKNMLVFCACQSVNNNINALETKLLKLNKEYFKLDSKKGEDKRFENKALLLSLKSLVKEHDLDVSEDFLKSLIAGNRNELSYNNRILGNYLDALNYVKRAYVNKLDDNFLAELYSRLLGTDNLTSFYRTSDDKSKDNRAIIDHIFTCAPASMIEGMMDTLFTFIETASISTSVKAAITYFYIDYIKPFDHYSDEIALLMAKAIYAKEAVEEFAIYLPIEDMLSEELESIAKISVEVQRTNDITYFVNYAMKSLSRKISNLYDEIVQIQNDALRSDYYTEDDKQVTTYTEQATVVEPKIEPQPVQPAPIVFEQPQVQQLIVETKVEEVPQKQPEPEVKEGAPIVVEEKPEPKKVVYVKEELAVSYIPPALDEKEAYRLEQHLLESDVELKKGEARFYARHCVVGKKYTIQQYKKALGCAYETARTSMDHLAELGYYKKEQVKNKYVYSPIPQNKEN